MTSILTYIKEHILEIIIIIGIGAVVLINTFPPRVTSESSEIRQIRTELANANDAIERVLDGIREYEVLIRERDEQIDDLRDYITGEVQSLRGAIGTLGQSNLGQGDRAIESAILIDESLRLLREIRETE